MHCMPKRIRIFIPGVGERFMTMQQCSTLRKVYGNEQGDGLLIDGTGFHFTFHDSNVDDGKVFHLDDAFTVQRAE